jgi:uncharacterized damage-inducible protein DinB
MANKQELIKEMSELISSAERLRQINLEQWEAPIAEGKWAVRDIISHIALWDEYYFNEAIHRIATNDSLSVRSLDFEKFNQDAITYATSRTKDQLIDEMITHRTNIVNDLQQIPEEAYTVTYQTADENPFLLTEYIEDFAGHDQHHLNQISAFLQQQSV